MCQRLTNFGYRGFHPVGGNRQTATGPGGLIARGSWEIATAVRRPVKGLGFEFVGFLDIVRNNCSAFLGPFHCTIGCVFDGITVLRVKPGFNTGGMPLQLNKFVVDENLNLPFQFVRPIRFLCSPCLSMLSATGASTSSVNSAVFD